MTRYDLTFRVFVSSTLGDFIEERNALQNEVFPRTREYCRLQGARFQAIDLRWGVPRDVANDQQTLDLCLQELRACQQHSPGANLIVLVGQRYGWRPLPSRIEASEFDLLLGIVPPRQARRLRKWYRCDHNAVPAEYLLRPRRRFVQRDRWARLERVIHKSLAEAARTAFPADDSRLAKYHDSATHAEIRQGIIESSEGVNALCYLRTIQGLPEDQTAAAYRDMHIDISGKWIVDSEAKSRIETLRKKIASLSPDCLHTYKGEWENGAPTIDLKVFSERVEADLKRRIDAELHSFQSESSVVRERRLQFDFAITRGAEFCGRKGVIESINQYLRSNSRQPLIVTGSSGAGKTAVLAKIWLDLGVANSEVICLARLIGATRGSSELRPLLRSLCLDLEAPAQAHSELPDDVRDLVFEFNRRLQSAAQGTDLILILDGLDQLAPTDDAHSLHWLPQGELPVRVKLLLSMRTGAEAEQPCLLAARQRFPTSFLQLPELVGRDGEEMLGIWLEGTSRGCDSVSLEPVPRASVQKRVLQPEQKSVLLQGFAKCPLPLYLKLAFEEARRWRSYDVVGPIAPDIHGLLYDLFRRLERPEFHGPLLPGRLFGYLKAARRGLSEDELLAILSDDKDVMENFRERSPDSPNVDTLPVVMWLRLASDLAPYLLILSFEGATVISFQHQQMAETVSDLYLAGAARQERHQALAHYFGRHSFLPDTDEPQSVKQRIAALDFRQVDELPWQLTEASSLGSDSAFAQLSSILTDLTFVEAKCLSGHLHDLIEDIFRAIRVAQRLDPHKDDWRMTDLLGYARELAAYATRRRIGDTTFHPPKLPTQRSPVVEKTDSSAIEHLQEYAKFLNQSAHLLGRYPHEAIPIARSNGTERSLVDAAAALCQKRKAVWIAQSPLDWKDTTSIRRVLRGTNECVAVDAPGRLAVTGNGRSETAAVWDLTTGELLRYLGGHHDEVTQVALTPDGQTAVTGGGTRRHVIRAGIFDGAVMATALIDLNGIPRKIVPDYSLRIWDTATGSCRGELVGHSNSISGLAVSADGEVIVSVALDGSVRLWSSRNLRCTFANYIHLPNPRSLSLDAAGDLVAIVCERGKLHVWRPRLHDWTVTAAPPGEKILAADVTPDGGLIVALTDRSLIAKSFAPAFSKIIDIREPLQSVSSEMPMSEILNQALYVQAALKSAQSDPAVKVLLDEPLSEWFERFSMTAVSIPEAEPSDPPDERQKVLLKVNSAIFGSAFEPNKPAIRVSDDGQTVVAIDGSKLVTWLQPAVSQNVTAKLWRRKLESIAMTADGRFALVGGAGGVEYLDISKLEEQRGSSQESTGTMEILASASSGSQLITRRSSNGQRQLLIARPSRSAISAVATVIVEGACAQARRGEFCSSGNLIAVVTVEDTIDVLDTQTGQLCGRIDNEGSAFTRVTSAPHCDVLLTADDRHRLRVWEASSGRLRTEMSDHGTIRCIAVSNDGSTALSAGENGQAPVLRVWDVKSGRLVHRLHGHRTPIDEVILDHRGTAAISVSAQQPDGTLRFWDVESGLFLREEPVEPLILYSGDVIRARHLRFAPDGATLAIGGLNNDMSGVRLFHSLAGPLDVSMLAQEKFWRLDFVRSGRALVGHAWGGTRLSVWDVVTGDLLADYPEASSIWPLDFTWVDSTTGLCVLPVGSDIGSFEIKNLPPREMSIESITAALASDQERRRLSALWYAIDHPLSPGFDTREAQSYYQAILDHVCLPGDRLSHEVLRHAAIRVALVAGQRILPHALSRLTVESDWRAVGALAVVIGGTASRPLEAKVCTALGRAAEHADLRTRKQVGLVISHTPDQWGQEVFQALRQDEPVARFLEQVDAGTASARELLEGLGPPDQFTATYLCPSASRKIQEFKGALAEVEGRSVTGFPTWPGGTHPYFERLRCEQFLKESQDADHYEAAVRYQDQIRFLTIAHELDRLDPLEARTIESVACLTSLSVLTKRVLVSRLDKSTGEDRYKIRQEIVRSVELIQAGWETISDKRIRGVWNRLSQIERTIDLIKALGAEAALKEVEAGIGAREWVEYLRCCHDRKAEALFCLANRAAQGQIVKMEEQLMTAFLKHWSLRKQARALQKRFKLQANVASEAAKSPASNQHQGVDVSCSSIENTAIDQDLIRWKALPWWKRLVVRRPKGRGPDHSKSH